MDKDIEELRGLLPAPVSADLTADRHRLLKEHLMQEITEPAVARRQRRRLAVALVAAAAVAGLATVGAVMGLRDEPARAPVVALPSATATTTKPGLPDTPLGQFATQVALVASQSDLTVGKDQYLYVKSRVAFRNGEGRDKDLGLDPLHDREIWLPGDAKKKALVKENGHTEEFSVGQTNEQRFAGLPTDPHRLLEKIYKDTAGTGHGREEAAFDQIHYYLVEALPPSPELLAALYQAAALIPGWRRSTRSTRSAGTAWRSPCTTSSTDPAASGSSTRRPSPTWGSAASRWNRRTVARPAGSTAPPPYSRSRWSTRPARASS
ncbi:CU044_5270 family protein [Paractinoplanes durhamensis]|uniref:CU044_5270 family protein n=1 Tax=Paractinoplanes durhamensis TaxID=113563 RepID=UPI003633E2B0